MQSNFSESFGNKTFIEKAALDYKMCRQHMDERVFWCAKSRNRMVSFLEASVHLAKETGCDDALYATYCTLDVMMFDWLWEDQLKNIISTTLKEVKENKITRQPKEPIKKLPDDMLRYIQSFSHQLQVLKMENQKLNEQLQSLLRQCAEKPLKDASAQEGLHSLSLFS